MVPQELKQRSGKPYESFSSVLRDMNEVRVAGGKASLNPRVFWRSLRGGIDASIQGKVQVFQRSPEARLTQAMLHAACLRGEPGLVRKDAMNSINIAHDGGDSRDRYSTLVPPTSRNQSEQLINLDMEKAGLGVSISLTSGAVFEYHSMESFLLILKETKIELDKAKRESSPNTASFQKKYDDMRKSVVVGSMKLHRDMRDLSASGGLIGSNVGKVTGKVFENTLISLNEAAEDGNLFGLTEVEATEVADWFLSGLGINRKTYKEPRSSPAPSSSSSSSFSTSSSSSSSSSFSSAVSDEVTILSTLDVITHSDDEEGENDDEMEENSIPPGKDKSSSKDVAAAKQRDRSVADCAPFPPVAAGTSRMLLGDQSKVLSYFDTPKGYSSFFLNDVLGVTPLWIEVCGFRFLFFLCHAPARPPEGWMRYVTQFKGYVEFLDDGDDGSEDYKEAIDEIG
jgi:hypothetical protein